MKRPCLSVIIPVYNTSRYLEACLESVTSQTLQDLEVILVDDGSTDGSGAICDAAAARDPRVRVIHKHNEGLGMARNSGLDIARGEFVTFIDSDDTIHPRAYADAVGLMKARDLDQTRFTCNRFNDLGEATADRYDGEPCFFEGESDMRRLALAIFAAPSPSDIPFQIGGSSCMAVYRLDIIRDRSLRFESEREYISEDYLFNLDYYLKSRRVGYLPRTYYHYRVSPGGLTHNLPADFMARVEKFCRHIDKALSERGFDASATLCTRGFYIDRLRVMTKNVFNSHRPVAEKRRWFKSVTAPGSYLLSECASYPASAMSLPQRIFFRTAVSRAFLPAFIIVRALSILKPDRLK